MAILTPGTAAPLGSVTWPFIEPAVVCPQRAGSETRVAQTNAAATTRAPGRRDFALAFSCKNTLFSSQALTCFCACYSAYCFKTQAPDAPPLCIQDPFCCQAQFYE